jgi:hypothetical protein
MTPARWQQIRRVFDGAAGLAPAERTEFLRETCAGDAELRAEVEALLAADERTGSFLSAPAYEVGAELVAGSETGANLGGTPREAALVKTDGHERIGRRQGSANETGTREVAAATASHERRQRNSAGRLRGRPIYFWVTLTFGVVLVCYYAFAFTTLYRYHGVTKDAGFGYGYWAEDDWRVAGVRPGSPADGLLRDGDRILAVNGDRRVAVTGPWLHLRATAASLSTRSRPRSRLTARTRESPPRSYSSPASGASSISRSR